MDEDDPHGFDSPLTALSEAQSLLAGAALSEGHTVIKKGDARP